MPPFEASKFGRNPPANFLGSIRRHALSSIARYRRAAPGKPPLKDRIMHTNQQQQTHTPEPVLPREEEVHAYLLHNLGLVRRVAGIRHASITVTADTFDTKLGVRVAWRSYVEHVPVTSTQYPTALEALKDITERAAACTTAAKIIALRAKADELERGAQ